MCRFVGGFQQETTDCETNDVSRQNMRKPDIGQHSDPSEPLAASSSSGEEFSLGQKLRVLRRDKGLTLKQVADQAGLSVGFISQVERDLTAPSLSSLANMSKVLGSPLNSFFEQPDNQGALTRNNSRPVYSLAQRAMEYERISTSFDGSILNSVIIHEPPGHRSEPMRHEGEEIFYVLQGALTVELDGERLILNSGDSLHFASHRQHSIWNHTTAPVTLLHICTMDVFGEAGRAEKMPGHRAGHEALQDQPDKQPTKIAKSKKSGRMP